MPDRVAGDIMIPLEEYASVHAEASLHKALLVLMKNLPLGHRSLAVVENGQLVGFLTTRTFLRALEVHGLDELAWDRVTWGNFFTRIEKDRLKNVKAKNIMRPIYDVFVREDAPLPEVTRLLLRKQVNHIPVQSGEGDVIGIIRTIDVLDILAGFLEK